MMRWLLCGLSLLLSSAGAIAAPRPGWVSWVMDGDTLLVVLDDQHEPIKVRVKDIDAPESCQPGGEASREALVALAMRQRVEVDLVAEDVYGRQVARVMRGDLDLGAEMVRTGMAWAYRFKTGKGPYARLQRQAQAQQTGLFAAKETAMSPPVFRQFHGSCHGS
jgi:endonuclease YncB( thermonuclease family)